jgi:CYTH domain-containing protein
MGALNKETERKFLVNSFAFRNLGNAVYYCQGYLNDDPGRVVRVRIAGEKAFLTIKGKNEGITRPEYEYDIPVEDAGFMLKSLCLQPVIEKYRYKIPWGDLFWEVDEFSGENEGLVIAEIELPDENHPFDIPEWIGEEVTSDEKYYNVNLRKNPYKNWREVKGKK